VTVLSQVTFFGIMAGCTHVVVSFAGCG